MRTTYSWSSNGEEIEVYLDGYFISSVEYKTLTEQAKNALFKNWGK